MKIDYVIPTWNSERTIKKCLEAIVSYGNPKEIIIVDNYSKDDTIKIAKSFGCKIIYDKKSLGSARIRGLKEASTEWVGFVDSDVVISKDWYKKMVRYTKKSRVGAIQGRKLPIMQPFRKIEIEKTKKIFEKGYYKLRKGERGYTDNTLIRKNVAIEADIENLNAFEDYIITQTIIEKGYEWICIPAFSDHYEKWGTFIKKSGWHSSGLKYLLRNKKIDVIDFLKIFFKYDLWYLKDGLMAGNMAYLKTRLLQWKFHWLGLIQSEKMFKLER